ncbi:MAG TPA: DUF1573 domain-containing protein [Chitinophagaceae bacterium]|nr:DUF1573 domain-containing protein [Chitinophagaceae bacterium]
MKRISILIPLLAACFMAVAQADTKVSDTTTIPKEDPIVLKEMEHDFDKIPQGKPVYYSFLVTNTGTTELKLDDVHASCGCTTPEWSRSPIAPGGTTLIKVGYNAAAEGYFEKFITVSYNTSQNKQIKIKGTVWKAPEGAAPANASVEFLKKQSL